ncbi:DUF1223 domain-containing protein [Trinickia fusca]|uniref:DUF1223 domain-containing protein n=1 Tax=Trinickia fusca TaxID=2419777 RepID=A0A494XND1_9BURK|nr:DUF1223 domain-containing protein [Trinickia fusca]RKP52177.1 DUF1223 domain-containing protein [Trinickia fusca]
MRIRTFLTVAAAMLAILAGTAAAHADEACAVRSPAYRVALVELYSSEGCNSCPPADAWLGHLAADTRGNVVPLALHVDYWDGLGWRDRFAQHRFTERQQALAAYGGTQVVYTPEVFVAGREMREWGAAKRFDERVRALAAQPARADIALRLAPAGTAGAIDVDARFAAHADAPSRLNAYVAVYENRLESHVGAGENRGATLHHERVVREWLGPLPLEAGAAHIQRTIALDGPAERRGSPAALTQVAEGRFGVAAFVEDAATGEIVQATALAACGR